MLRNYLKITFRSLSKNKLFVAINVLGLSVAMACCIVAYLNYNFGANFDSDQTNVDNVYRIDVNRTLTDRSQLYGFSPIPLAEAAKANIGSLEAIMRYMPSGTNYRVADESFSQNIVYTDPNFFSFFDVNILAGDPANLAEPKNIFISSEIAEKYFPDGQALGQLMTRLTENGPEDHIVAGIFEKKPMNSSFGGLETITHIDNYLKSEPGLENDWTDWVTTFVKVNPAEVTRLEEELNARFVDIQRASRIDFQINEYVLEPFIGMGVRADAGEVWGHWFWTAPPRASTTVPGIMAILILLIACFNFTNTSMAIAGKRLKEIGLRKVMGGMRKQLVTQFMLENLFLCFFAMVFSLIIAYFLVPAYSAMWPFLEIHLSFTDNIQFYIFLIIILFVTGLLAGTYPAFYVSKFEPAAILRRNLKYGGSSRFTNFLLGAQFTISMVAIIMGIVFYQNARYQETLDYGFNTTGAISLYFDDKDDYFVFKNEIESDPRVLSLAGSEHQMDRSYRNDPVISGTSEYDVDILHVGEGFFETIGFRLLDGRKFRTNSQTDMQESVIVTEEMVQRFGWEEPLGQKIVWMDTVQLYVVGVMKDVFVDGLWNPVNPLMIRYVPESDYHFMTVKYPIEETVAMNEYLKSAWSNTFPNEAYTGLYLDEEMSNAADINRNILIIFTSLGIIATFLSAMGLFSLVSLNILKRMKEIGVRKVLGASAPSIVHLINRKYIYILLIACTLASIFSFYAAIGLMDSIWSYHITPNILSFGAGILLIFVVAFSTIGFKVFRAAMANPTDIIRME